jgi:hypothetical protein
VFGRDEGRAVIADQVRVLDDLLGLEVAQVDDGDTRALALSLMKRNWPS